MSLKMMDMVRDKLQCESNAIRRLTENIDEPQINRVAEVCNIKGAAIIAVIAVFDAIAIAISKTKGHTKKEFLLIHPGGR